MKSNLKTAHVSQDRWLVSYADFITLLLAFFIILFASSQTDRRKAEASVRKAFSGQTKLASVTGGAKDEVGQGNRMMRGPGGMETPSPAPETEPLQSSFLDLQTKLHDEIGAGALSVQMETRGLVISLKEASYFVSGDDQLAAPAIPVVDKIAQIIAPLPNAVRLEGHTDSVPIKNSRFKGNWELSAARGIVVLRMLASNFGIPEGRMSVAGYADTSPIDLNDTVEGRARNRRVDVVILNQSGTANLPPGRISTQ